MELIDLKFTEQLVEKNVDIDANMELDYIDHDCCFSIKNIMIYFLLGWSLTALACLFLGSVLY
jgi:hypothetical protein